MFLSSKSKTSLVCVIFCDIQKGFDTVGIYWTDKHVYHVITTHDWHDSIVV